MAVKLRRPTNGVTLPESTPEAPAPIPIIPLEVSGLLISKGSLVRTLRSFVPNLQDILVLESGDQFILVVGLPTSTDTPPA